MLESNVISARVNRQGVVSRRGFVRTIGLGGAGLAGVGWYDFLIAAAPTLHKKGKSIIVLWMQGGPSQFETFDPKPDSESGAQTKTIASATPGIQIADLWPNVAKQMDKISLIRSMTNREGNHQRATFQMHTGYVPNPSIEYPSIGSLINSQTANPECDLPGFVSVIGPSGNAGFLPVDYAPFRIQDPSRMPNNTDQLVSPKRDARRMSLLGDLEKSYARAGARQQVEDHQSLYRKASRLIRSPQLVAFDISQEPQKVREAYGSSAFGQGCLLARRLVESGVTFVEVQLGNWDTHQDNLERVTGLARQCDPAFAALVADLKERGRLDDTLVVWMGEFGRTPRINPREGRDHYPRAFSVAVAGGGVQGGRVVGRTSKTGSQVQDRPVGINDLFQTFCHCAGVDPEKENVSPLGRPITIVDGGESISELFT